MISNTKNDSENNSQFIEILSKCRVGGKVLSHCNCGLYALVNAINDNEMHNYHKYSVHIKIVQFIRTS